MKCADAVSTAVVVVVVVAVAVAFFVVVVFVIIVDVPKHQINNVPDENDDNNSAHFTQN